MSRWVTEQRQKRAKRALDEWANGGRVVALARRVAKLTWSWWDEDRLRCVPEEDLERMLAFWDEREADRWRA